MVFEWISEKLDYGFDSFYVTCYGSLIIKPDDEYAIIQIVFLCMITISWNL
jgi:hypothetical protein